VDGTHLFFKAIFFLEVSDADGSSRLENSKDAAEEKSERSCGAPPTGVRRDR